MTLMEKLLDAGYPRNEMFNHCSDLYVFATPLTAKVIASWFKTAGLNKNLFCSTFTDLVTGQKMYDCAFQYDDFWKALQHG